MDRTPLTISEFVVGVDVVAAIASYWRTDGVCRLERVCVWAYPRLAGFWVAVAPWIAGKRRGFPRLDQSRSGSPSSGSGSVSGNRSVSRVLISWSMSAGWATPGWRLPAVDRMSSTMIVRLISRSPDRLW